MRTRDEEIGRIDNDFNDNMLAVLRRARQRMGRLKPVEDVLRGDVHETALRRELSWYDLLGLGVGCIIGAGLFVITGVAARVAAGPSVILSYFFAGLACVFSGLCYAEFSARIPVAGSAYVYTYCTLGEFMAWLVGWNLVLEYVVSVAAVARGWSSYFVTLLGGFGVHYPEVLFEIPFNCINGTSTAEAIDAGNCNTIDLTAFMVVAVLTVVTAVGTKSSSTINAIMMAITLLTIFFIIFAGTTFVDPVNWSDFMPFGFEGTVRGAAIVFFSYVGFDSVSTFAEESKNPQRDMPIGIVGSIIISSILYCSVALVLTGMVPYYEIDLNAPLAAAFAFHGWPWAEVLVAMGAFLALTTSTLGMLMGMPRIFLAMARDGLFFPIFKYISPRFNTPIYGALITGVMACALTLLVDIELLADMVSIGTLFAFYIVCASVIIVRLKSPERPNRGTVLVLTLTCALVPPLVVGTYKISAVATGLLWILPLVPTVILFREPRAFTTSSSFLTPFVPLTPIVGMMANLYLMINLNMITWLRFVVWIIIGLAIYGFYGMRHSTLEFVEAASWDHDGDGIPMNERSQTEFNDDENEHDVDDGLDEVLFDPKTS